MPLHPAHGDFAAIGNGDGIGWGLCDDIENAVIGKEEIIDRYFTTRSRKAKRLGPAPIRPSRVGCIWRMACATPPPACVTCSICFCAT